MYSRKEARGSPLFSCLNGVQVVGGSNPPTPTSSQSQPRGQQSAELLRISSSWRNFVNTFVHTGVYKTLSSSSLKEINRCQQKLGLSDRTVARLLGISVTYLSLLKHSKRPISAVLMRHIHDLDPQDVIAAVEVLPRKSVLVCMETDSNANVVNQRNGTLLEPNTLV